MRAGIILGDMTIHCAPDADAGRVCAIDVTGLIAVLSLITRFFALAANSCINIVGRADSAGLSKSCCESCNAQGGFVDVFVLRRMFPGGMRIFLLVACLINLAYGIHVCLSFFQLS